MNWDAERDAARARIAAILDAFRPTEREVDPEDRPRVALARELRAAADNLGRAIEPQNAGLLPDRAFEAFEVMRRAESFLLAAAEVQPGR